MKKSNISNAPKSVLFQCQSSFASGFLDKNMLHNSAPILGEQIYNNELTISAAIFVKLKKSLQYLCKVTIKV